MIRINRIVKVALVAMLMVVAGCRSMSTDYGQTKGLSGRSSLNGFGALRESFERAGFRNRDVSRLTDRVMQTDVIVWTPQMLTGVDVSVTSWFDRWLRRGGRTLVYIVPDSGSEADYWMDASKLAPPPQRLEYRRRAARSINERMAWRMNRFNVSSNGWLHIESLIHRTPMDGLAGPWKDDIGEVSAEETPFAVEYKLIAYDATNPPPAVPFAPGNAGPTGPGSPGWSFPVDASPTSTPTQFRSLLETGSGVPIVAEIHSNQWRDSRILVVAGGSLLTNYAFTRPLNRKLASRLIQASKPANVSAPTAGFVTTSWGQIPVSERQPGVPEASGMELLTVWPLSLVTMHGLMLALVICLMLLPIFGRPRRIRRTNESEFGDHLDAVAALMNKAGGERYARMRISEYFKRMHGETAGPWVLPDPAPASGPQTAPKINSLKPKQLAARRPQTPVPNETRSIQTKASETKSPVQSVDETTPLKNPPPDEVER
jgi:hypothetical protein